jgi:hypothetical protein
MAVEMRDLRHSLAWRDALNPRVVRYQAWAAQQLTPADRPIEDLN